MPKMPKKSDKLKLEVDTDSLMQRKDSNMTAAAGLIVGLMFGIALFNLSIPGLGHSLIAIGGPTPMDVFTPLICVGLAGTGLSALSFLNSGRSLRELLFARFMKKDYKYGVTMRSDAHGAIEVAKLKKHDDDTYYFTDPRSRAPVLVEKSTTYFPVQTHYLDGVEILLAHSTDVTPAKVNGETAATRLLAVVYETRSVREPLYKYDRDQDGNYLVDKDGNYLRTVIDYQDSMQPVYPQMSRIPKNKLQAMGDMVFNTDDPEALFKMAMENVVMDSNVYQVPMKDLVPLFDAKGEQIVGEDGRQKFVEKEVLDENNQVRYRVAEPHEVNELKKQRALELVNEAKEIRKRLVLPEPDSGRSLLNVLTSIVKRRWMQSEMSDVAIQAKNQVDTELKDKRMREKQVDDGFVIMLGVAVGLVILAAGLIFLGVKLSFG